MKFSVVYALRLILTGIVMLIPGAASAEVGICEGDVWSQMQMRARLHGQMDLAVAENLIYKPDSVLEYTCFDRFITVLGANASFYIDPGLLDVIIRYSMEEYLFENFGHTYMGGRAPPNNTPAPGGTEYICSAMTAVWSMAKCLNSENTHPTNGSIIDVHYTLADFITADDIRVLPNVCVPPEPTQFGNVPVDPMPPITTGYLAIGACGDPIPTGLTADIEPKSGENRPPIFEDNICPNPTCTYNPNGDTCEPME